MNKEKSNSDMLSLFDVAPTGSSAKIDVVKLSYEYAESTTWQELFAGFNKLHAITFSSGINFVYKLLDMFDYSEIIFGCEAVMSFTLQEIMAYQDRLLERMRESASTQKLNLISRLDSGSVRFYVARTALSHEKLYLLEADDGRKRVIMGSANMSFQAFSGAQRENIFYVDGETAYQWYWDVFLELKENSSDEIKREAVSIADLSDNIDELPIANTIKTNKAMVIETVNSNLEDIRFILDTQKLAKNLSPIMPTADKKSNKIKISPDTFVKIRRQIKNEEIKEKELRS